MNSLVRSMLTGAIVPLVIGDCAPGSVVRNEHEAIRIAIDNCDQTWGRYERAQGMSFDVSDASEWHAKLEGGVWVARRGVGALPNTIVRVGQDGHVVEACGAVFPD